MEIKYIFNTLVDEKLENVPVTDLRFFKKTCDGLEIACDGFEYFTANMIKFIQICN